MYYGEFWRQHETFFSECNNEDSKKLRNLIDSIRNFNKKVSLNKHKKSMKTFKILVVAFFLLSLSSCCGGRENRGDDDSIQKCVILVMGKHDGDYIAYYMKLKDLKNDSIHSEEVTNKLYLLYKPGDTIMF